MYTYQHIAHTAVYHRYHVISWSAVFWTGRTIQTNSRRILYMFTFASDTTLNHFWLVTICKHGWITTFLSSGFPECEPSVWTTLLVSPHRDNFSSEMLLNWDAHLISQRMPAMPLLLFLQSSSGSRVVGGQSSTHTTADLKISKELLIYTPCVKLRWFTLERNPPDESLKIMLYFNFWNVLWMLLCTVSQFSYVSGKYTDIEVTEL